MWRNLEAERSSGPGTSPRHDSEIPRPHPAPRPGHGRPGPRLNPAVWHARAKHCPLCGAPLVPAEVQGRVRPRCSACPFVLYRNPASAAAGAVLDARGRVLLVRRGIEPFRGDWAFPAGYQEVDESPEQAVVREVREEAGVLVRVERLLELVFVPDDPRKPANVAIFLCSHLSGEARAGDDADEAAWFDLEQLPERIGFDNNRRILARLREPDKYPGAPCGGADRGASGPGLGP